MTLSMMKRVNHHLYYQNEGEIIWDKSKPDGTPKKQLDISRIKSLGWEPTIELDKGIEKTISTYKQERLLNNLK